MKYIAALSLVAGASAFAPAAKQARPAVAVQETKSDLEAMGKQLNPIVVRHHSRCFVPSSPLS